MLAHGVDLLSRLSFFIIDENCIFHKPYPHFSGEFLRCGVAFLYIHNRISSGIGEGEKEDATINST
jgi:hypothetical protein